MPRYAIGWTTLEQHKISAEQLRDNLKKYGARNVRLRHQFGWSNQPHVPTFTAPDLWEARRIATIALGAECYPYDIESE